MKRSLVLASVGLLLAAPRALGGPGEVTAVSVLPGPGSVNIVIDVRGGVQVSDFTLKEPARLVVDVKGATLHTRGILYDRINRDRKSTRLNSSHLGNSYAVFCLKK